MTDARRLCGFSSETIQRLIASRLKPIQNTYKHRYDQAAKFHPSGTGETASSSWETVFSALQIWAAVRPGKQQLQTVVWSYPINGQDFIFNRQDTTLVANTKRKQHSSSYSFPCTDITISYKNRLMHTYIINTTLLALYHSDMFRTSKGHLEGERLIYCCENVSVVLPQDGPSMAETCRKGTLLIKWC